MEHQIFKKQTEIWPEIENVFAQFKDSSKWEKALKAFKLIIKTFIHGENASITDKEIEEYFKRALTLTTEDIEQFLRWIEHSSSSNITEKPAYYLANVSHQRNDKFFAPKQACPITGTGNKTLTAHFDAKNLYRRFQINASTELPQRLQKLKKNSQEDISHDIDHNFSSWEGICSLMSDRAKFDQAFGLTQQQQADQIFKVVSAFDWDEVQGEVLLTPDMFDGATFSPALFAVFFFGPNEANQKEVFLIITADGTGNPEMPFIGLVTQPSDSQEKVFDSTNRFKFTYLSSKENKLKYWVKLDEEKPSEFTMGIQTFYPQHPETPYIEVISDFSGQVRDFEIDFYKDTPALKILMMLQKGALMRDLIEAYYPDESSLQYWEDVGALHKDGFLDKLAALGLDLLADIFAPFIWKEKPTVS